MDKKLLQGHDEHTHRVPEHTQEMRESSKRTPSIKDIILYLDKNIQEAVALVNSNYVTDAGTPIQDYQKGKLNTLIEVKSYINGGKHGAIVG